MYWNFDCSYEKIGSSIYNRFVLNYMYNYNIIYGLNINYMM